MPVNLDFEHLSAIVSKAPYLANEYFGNTLGHYLLIIVAVIFVYLISKIVTFLIEKFVQKLTLRTENKLDDLAVKIVHRSVTFILVLSTVYFGVRSLKMPASVDNFTVTAVFVLFTLKVAKELVSFLEFVIEGYLRPVAEKQKGLVKVFIPPLLRFIKFSVWVLAGLLIISNLGYNVTSLVAGLGIGGVALALAAQETLSNAFGSLMILTDQPFRVGDWVIIGEVEGEIVEIGFRSTKIQTMDRSIVSMPNTQIASETIENYSRRDAKKVEQTFSFDYGTSVAEMQKILKAILDVVHRDKDTETGSARAHFVKFGDSALEVEVLYYITDMTSYARYLDIRQRINLKIKAAVEKIGAEMAFPTQSLYLKNAKDIFKAAAHSRARK